MPEPYQTSHPLTQADCDTCLQIVQQRAPQWDAQLERMKRAGFDLQEPRQRNAANVQFARGILQEYFPDRAPIIMPTQG